MKNATESVTELTQPSSQTDMHTEKLSGRSSQIHYLIGEDITSFNYPDAYDVDMDKRFELDAAALDAGAVNRKIHQLIKEGVGHIVVQNPKSQHSMGVGILQRLKLDFEGSLGYFAIGLMDGPNVRIKGRVGWSCAENMMSGSVVVEKNAGSSFGAAIRGGDLVCKGSVGGRTGINQKGGTIIVGGRTGALTGFMMQRGRMIILGNADENLGDSMYDGVMYVGGTIKSLGVDAVHGELNEADTVWLKNKLEQYDMLPSGGVSNFKKVVAGKQLWNYDNLEPTEKKLVL